MVRNTPPPTQTTAAPTWSILKTKIPGSAGREDDRDDHEGERDERGDDDGRAAAARRLSGNGYVFHDLSLGRNDSERAGS
jgi:hypothetical protein